MSNEELHTLWLATDGLEVDDEVLAFGKTVAETAAFVRAYAGGQPYLFLRDYGAFRCLELRQYDSKNKLRTVISATVPKTEDEDDDRRRALEMIDVQTCARSSEFWPGRISTNAEFAARLERVKQRRAVRALDREIVTKVIDRLLEDGYRITCCLHEDEPSFRNSKARKGILSLLFDLELAELHVHKGDDVHWIKFIFDEEGWDVVADYSVELAGLIEPIVDPYLPWNRPGSSNDRGYSVFVLPSPDQLDRRDPSAEVAVKDIFDRLGRIL